MQNFIKTIINAVQSWTKKEIKNSTADWNQNDASAVDHVKNRTHYRENVVIVPNISVSQSHVFENLTEDIIENEIYQVIFDDEIYECSATSGRFVGTNEQQYFLIEYFRNNILLYLLDNEEHTISIQGPSIKKLQSIYMPDDIFTKQRSFNFGNLATASGDCSHAEGNDTTASGFGSHAEGYGTTASGDNSHAEGYGTTASGFCSHAEVNNTTASGEYSHAEGHYTTASGDHSHAEGYETIASGEYSHAEGYETIASNCCSHTAGSFNKEKEDSFGFTTRKSTYSFDFENVYVAKNFIFNPLTGKFKLCDPVLRINANDAISYIGYAFLGGEDKIPHESLYIILGKSGSTSYPYSVIKYQSLNKNNYTKGNGYLHCVGNGTANEHRSNAHTLDWNGVGWFQGGLQVGGNAQDDGAKNVLLEGDIPQSDWTQNDETAVDYIKNRTHWVEVDEYVIFKGTLPIFTATTNLPLQHALSDDAVVTAYYNGSEIGSVVGYQPDSNAGKLHYDFSPDLSLTVNNGTMTASVYNGAGDGVLKFAVVGQPVIHPMDEKYIPDSIARVIDVPFIPSAQVGQTIVVSEVDENGKPTKWEAADAGGGDTKFELLATHTISEADADTVRLEWNDSTYPILQNAKGFIVAATKPADATGNKWIGFYINGIQVGSVSSGMGTTAKTMYTTWVQKNGDRVASSDTTHSNTSINKDLNVPTVSVNWNGEVASPIWPEQVTSIGIGSYGSDFAPIGTTFSIYVEVEA